MKGFFKFLSIFGTDWNYFQLSFSVLIMMDGSLMVRSKCRPDIDHHPIFEVAPDEKSYYQSRDQPTRSYVPILVLREIQNSKTLIINHYYQSSKPWILKSELLIWLNGFKLRNNIYPKWGMILDKVRWGNHLVLFRSSAIIKYTWPNNLDKRLLDGLK